MRRLWVWMRDYFSKPDFRCPKCHREAKPVGLSGYCQCVNCGHLS